MPGVDEKLRRKFESDWMSGQPGKLSDYLPPNESADYLPTLEELVCIDLEFRWNLADGGQRDEGSFFDLTNSSTFHGDVPTSTVTGKPLPMLESYLHHFPELNEPACVQRLIDQEILVRGSTPYPPKVDEYVSRFPDLGLSSSALQRIIAALPTMAVNNGSRPGGEGTLPREFGEYQLTKLLGRGGMGSVYEAEHRETGRVVALKMADMRTFAPDNRAEAAQRVATEIRAAASLTDDHLVPVYDVGSVGAATYYTMPILDGDLAGEIRRGPIEPQTAARYIADAARGVHTAHQNGLLHRDIKPHNMMLDKKADRVLVADFGLARFDTTDNSITKTGNLLGTPPYMSPEQIKNPADVDARADVYSLGATLYHLITGRPPLSSAETAETVRQVLQDDPLMPRELNPSIDKDLETICMKCLRKEADTRYDSAEDLEADLRRYLFSEPIVARPLGVAGRLIRWRRRNPALAVAIGALMIAMLFVSGFAYTTYHENQRFETSDKDANIFLLRLSELLRTTHLLKQPGGESARRQILQHMIERAEASLELTGNNRKLAGDNYKAQVEIAMLVLDLDGPKPAEEKARKAIENFKELNANIAGKVEVQIAYSDAWNVLGQALRGLKRDKESLQAFRRTLKIRTSLSEKHKSHFDIQRKHANALMNYGMVLNSLGNPSKATEQCRSAMKLRKDLQNEHEGNLILLRDIAQGEYSLARLEMEQGSFATAKNGFRNATDEFLSLSKKMSSDTLIWRRLIESAMAESELSLQIDGVDKASLESSKEHLEIAFDYLRKLALLSVDNRSYRLELTRLVHHAVELSLRLGAPDALKTAREGWEIADAELLIHFDRTDVQPDIRLLRIEHLAIDAMLLVFEGNEAQAKQTVRRVFADRDLYEKEVGQIKEDDSVIDWRALRQILQTTQPEQMV